MLTFVAGGIADSRGVLAARLLGADSVQIGTALLLSHESLAPEAHKAALADVKRNETTILTRRWTGRHARGQPNQFIKDHANDVIPAYPIQNYLTGPLRQAAGRGNDFDRLSLWSGQAAPLCRRDSAENILNELIRGCDELANSL